MTLVPHALERVRAALFGPRKPGRRSRATQAPGVAWDAPQLGRPDVAGARVFAEVAR